MSRNPVFDHLIVQWKCDFARQRVEGVDAHFQRVRTGLECAATANGVLLRAPSWATLSAGLSAAPRPKGSRLRVEVDPARS